MIEQTIREYLLEELDVPVYLEVPEEQQGSFVTLEKTGSQRTNHINSATMAVQSWADSMYEAAALNEKVKAAMDSLPEKDDISSLQLNSDYNYTDTRTKKYRYQAVYDVVYY